MGIFKDNKKLITVLIIACILLFGFSSMKLWLVPGPEGIRVVNYGVQFGAYDSIRKASTADPLPTQSATIYGQTFTWGYAWGSTQPSVMSIKHLKALGEPWGGIALNGPSWWYDNDYGEVRSEVQRPRLYDDPIGVSAQTLTYYKYTKVANDKIEIKKVIVQIIPADFVFQLSIVAGSGLYTFKDVRLWYALDTVTWLNAYINSPPNDPNPLTNDTVQLLSSNYRGAFPIIAWIGEYKDWVFVDDYGNYRTSPPDDNAAGFVQLDPSLRGRFIDLYTTPSSTYDLMLSSDIAQNPDLLQQALIPNALPDPRFAQTVYYYITLTRFGAYIKKMSGSVLWDNYEVWYPSVWYRMRVVYAVYGEYVYLWTTQTAEQVGYTNETWEVRRTSKEIVTTPWTDWWNWLGANIFGIGAFFFLLIIAITALVLFWFFGMPRRRGKEQIVDFKYDVKWVQKNFKK